MTIDVSTSKKPPFRLSGFSIPGLSMMDRYITTELIVPFVFGVVAFTSIGISTGVLLDLLRRVSDSGLPMSIAMQFFVLRLPYFVGLAFPMSMVLACLLVYGRLSSDSELIALRSCGVSIYRLVAPAVVIGLIMSGITFAFNEAVVPAANLKASQLLDQALNKNKPSFKERNILYRESKTIRLPSGEKDELLSRLFYAREFDGQQMKGLTILDFSQKGLNQIVASDSAKWNAEEKTWDFFNGTIYVVAPNGSYRNIVRFDRQQIQLPRTPLDIAKTARDSEEMTISEIRQYIDLIGQTGNQKEIRKMRLRIEQKSSMPFASLSFGLVAATLGIRPQRSGRAAGFGLTLIIVVSYYALMVAGQILYQAGIVNAFIGGWLPTLVALAAGVILVVKLNR